MGHSNRQDETDLLHKPICTGSDKLHSCFNSYPSSATEPTTLVIKEQLQ